MTNNKAIDYYEARFNRLSTTARQSLENLEKGIRRDIEAEREIILDMIEQTQCELLALKEKWSE